MCLNFTTSLSAGVLTVFQWKTSTVRYPTKGTQCPYRPVCTCLTCPFYNTCPHCSPLLLCCFTSTEARWLIRDGDRGGRGRKNEGSTADTARKRPDRPWTAARLVYCAIAVSTAVLGQSHKDNVRCTAVDEQLGQLEAKEVQLSQPSSTSLLMISSGLT